MISEPTFGALCALGAALAWSVTSLLARSVMAHYGSVTINAVRSGVAGALLVACVTLTEGPAALVAMSATTFVLLAVSIVAAIAVGDTVFFESTRAIGLGRAMTIATTYPVGAAVMAAAFLHEAISVRVAVGTLLTLAGVAVIVAFRSGEPRPARLWFGVWTAALASAAWAVSTVMMKPPLREIEPLTAQAIRLPLASVLLWLTPWTRGAALLEAGRGPLLRIGALSLVTAASSVLFVAGLKHAGVAVGAVLSSTAPLFAIPLGVIFLGERLSPAAAVGTLLAVAGIVVLQL
ncbi:MAG TPA: DMT family transporter [Methylomirabilota bacterium]|nr:DMT family transporter [Methylomirabilota bacterium]